VTGELLLLAFQIGTAKFLWLSLVTAVFVTFVILSLAYIVFRMRRDLGESRPEHSQYLLQQTRKELLALAQKKREEKEQAAAMVEKLKEQDSRDEAARHAQEETRKSLAEQVQSAFGKSCPHCQVEMLAEDEIVICPVCLSPQHWVCFNLTGCINGCNPDHVYLYPSDRIIDLRGKPE